MRTASHMATRIPLTGTAVCLLAPPTWSCLPVNSAEQSNHLIGGSIVEAIKKTESINGGDNADEDLDLPISEGLFGINPS